MQVLVDLEEEERIEKELVGFSKGREFLSTGWTILRLWDWRSKNSIIGSRNSARLSWLAGWQIGLDS